MQLDLDDLISVHQFIEILDNCLVHFNVRRIGLMHALQLISKLLVLAFQTDSETRLFHFFSLKFM